MRSDTATEAEATITRPQVIRIATARQNEVSSP